MTYNVFSGTLNPTHFTSLEPRTSQSCRPFKMVLPKCLFPLMYWCIAKWGRRMLQMQEVQSFERGNVYSTYRQTNRRHHTLPPPGVPFAAVVYDDKVKQHGAPWRMAIALEIFTTCFSTTYSLIVAHYVKL